MQEVLWSFFTFPDRKKKKKKKLENYRALKVPAQKTRIFEIFGKK